MANLMTAEEHKSRTERSKKMLLLFAMVSMTMMFAGLVSAFVVSKSRVDWAKNFELPTPFFISTAIIILCSVTFYLAKKAIQKNDRQKTTLLLWLTLALGLGFVFFQYQGFAVLYLKNIFPVGSIFVSFLWIIVIAHLLHLAGGIISLLIIIYNHYKQKYNSTQTLGIELGAMYWHFLDLLWVLLFLFLNFFK